MMASFLFSCFGGLTWLGRERGPGQRSFRLIHVQRPSDAGQVSSEAQPPPSLELVHPRYPPSPMHLLHSRAPDTCRRVGAPNAPRPRDAISRLPSELFSEIMSHLPWPALDNCRMVSPFWWECIMLNTCLLKNVMTRDELFYHRDLFRLLTADGKSSVQNLNRWWAGQLDAKYSSYQLLGHSISWRPRFSRQDFVFSPSAHTGTNGPSSLGLIQHCVFVPSGNRSGIGSLAALLVKVDGQFDATGPQYLVAVYYLNASWSPKMIASLDCPTAHGMPVRLELLPPHESKHFTLQVHLNSSRLRNRPKKLAMDIFVQNSYSQHELPFYVLPGAELVLTGQIGDCVDLNSAENNRLAPPLLADAKNGGSWQLLERLPVVSIHSDWSDVQPTLTQPHVDGRRRRCTILRRSTCSTRETLHSSLQKTLCWYMRGGGPGA